MNRTFLLCLKFIFYTIILWFIVYFLAGDYISLEFANYKFALVFPRILTFATAASIYCLIVLKIKSEDGWNFSNIMKFIFGILLAFIPFIIFEYLSLARCNFWETTKTYKGTLYHSKNSDAEKIIVVESVCKNTQTVRRETKRVVSLTPLFNTVSSIDTATIKSGNWNEFKAPH